MRKRWVLMTWWDIPPTNYIIMLYQFLLKWALSSGFVSSSARVTSFKSQQYWSVGEKAVHTACTNHLFLMKFSLTAMKFIFPYLEGVLTWQFGMRTDCGGSRILLVKEARGFVLTLTIKKLKHSNRSAVSLESKNWNMCFLSSAESWRRNVMNCRWA